MTLWQRMEAVAGKARADGHLLSIPNEFEVIEEAGISFVLRYAPQLIEKIKASNPVKTSNPFLPPEPELWVGSIGEHHNLVLNKFNVLSLHGLITTKTFVEQTDLLTLSDFMAISAVLNEVDGLVFYNGGEMAGASQRHRHFQLVPKDMGAGDLPVDSAVAHWHMHELKQIFPFQHRSYWLPDTQPETLMDAWQKMEFSWQPYNLLITREWMLVIPRLKESTEGISVNSLGYAGALLAKNKDELDVIRTRGPIQILRDVAKA